MSACIAKEIYSLAGCLDVKSSAYRFLGTLVSEGPFELAGIRLQVVNGDGLWYDLCGEISGVIPLFVDATSHNVVELAETIVDCWAPVRCAIVDRLGVVV